MSERPISTLGFFDCQGFWHPPVSACCQSAIVRFEPICGMFSVWQGMPGDTKPEGLRCRNCNRQIEGTEDE